MADDIWIYDFKNGITENLTNNPAQDICPRWGPSNRIYFTSDRDGRMNLFATDLTTKETKQLTTFKDFDIKFPSIGKDSIVFEEAGYIWRYDLSSGQAAPIPIEVKEDFASGRSELVDASKHVESVNLAPDGERAIVVGRGDLLSVPMKEGTARNLSKSSNAHERDAIWSPDGKWIAYNSDLTGENELYVRAQDGKGQPQQVTSGADTYYYKPVWSPDSKKLLWADRLQRLRYVDVASKSVTQVDQDKFGEIQSYDWSPDSQWIAWARPEENDMPRVYIYSVANKKQTPVTDEWYGSTNVAFSDEGKYLLLASGRDFKPTFAEDEFENVYVDMQRIYLVTLAKDAEPPLGPRSDEVGKAEQKRAKQKEKEGEEKKAEEKKSPSPTQKTSPTPTPEVTPKKPVVVKVDLDGIHDRISGVEIVPGNYSDIRLVDDRIFYLRRTVADQEGEDEADQDARDRKAHLCFYSMEDRKETVLGDVNAYQISADGKRMLLKIKKDYAIIDLPKDKLETKDHELKLARLDMQLDKHAEWNQIYFECWRQMRDFFYAPNMNGIDWKTMRDLYDGLVGTADKQVILRVNSKPSDDGARDVTVVPTADESPLYYLAWVQKNIDYVSKKTNGEVGYLHIPDMGRPGLNEFTKLYFPQIRKHALIVDVRGNGGGFVSPLVVERLRRAFLMVGIARNGMPQPDPAHAFMGPMVTLINEFSASDGDIFPFRFKSLGLGKLIGKRTWGGVVGIRNSLPLVDGGNFFKPEFALYSKDGKEWIIEGHGVDPDIVVDNDPAKEFHGEDQQLDRGIQQIEEELKTKRYELPPVPPYPDRNPAKATQ